MASTIKDIARKLNVSTSTVSYALNGGPRSVPEDVKKRVFEAAEELNYRPNRVARSLITRRTNVIGVVPDRPSKDVMLGPFLHLATNGVMNAAEDREYDLMFFSRCDSRRPKETAIQLADNRIDAAVFVAGSEMHELLDEVARLGLPFAVIAMCHPKATVELNIDNEKASFLAVEHLYSLGHRRIAHLRGMEDLWDADLRYRGYLAALEQFELEPDPSLVEVGRYQRTAGMQATLRLLEQPNRPTAIYAANDEMAIGAMRAAQEVGLSVPKDLSIVGLDDTPSASAAIPSLTTVRQPILEMGERAAHCLIDVVGGEKIKKKVLFEPEIIVRQSTATPKPEAISQ